MLKKLKGKKTRSCQPMLALQIQRCVSDNMSLVACFKLLSIHQTFKYDDDHNAKSVQILKLEDNNTETYQAFKHSAKLSNQFWSIMLRMSLLM